MDLYLIRHGQTDWNKKGIMQGQTDIPLNHRGKEQAAFLADFFRSDPFPVRRIFSSPLSRAAQTAAFLGKALGLSVQILPQMKETNMGRWEGRTWEEIREHDAASYEAWLLDPYNTPHPGGESYRQVAERALSALLPLEDPSLPTVIVTHGDVMLALHACCRGGSLKEAPSRITGNLMRRELNNSSIWHFSLNCGQLRFLAPVPVDNRFFR